MSEKRYPIEPSVLFAAAALRKTFEVSDEKLDEFESLMTWFLERYTDDEMNVFYREVVRNGNR